jgi:endo-1,4-beta-xylanase
MHHCLIFPNKYFPSWFSKSNYSSNELELIIEKFVSEVLNSNDNKHKVDVFNVINEIFAMGKSGGYRVSGNEKEDCKWMDMGFEKDMSGLEEEQKINNEHPIFVRKVFDVASKLTDAKLEIRDFNIAFGGKKADGMYQLIKHLKNTGVRVDAVGFQCHLNAGIDYNYESLRKNILRFIDLGVEVYITELDVGLNLWGKGKKRKKVSDVIKSEDDWEWFFEEQNKIYYNLVKTAKESGVKLISDWGFRDDIPYGGWRKNQKAWMVNKDYSRKEAYYSVLKALYNADN